jgi:hypothetical protein
MQANELRIGNWYNDKRINRDFVVHGVSKHGIDHGDIDYSPTRIQNAMPIPLTEEWMTRFGFKKENTGGAGPQDNWAGMPAYSFEGEWLFRGSPSCLHLVGYFNTTVRYVHQLQNIYWCLFGKELELKQ